jgi:hypothetical protein
MRIMNEAGAEARATAPPEYWFQFALPPERRARFCDRLGDVPPAERRWLLMGLYVVGEGLTLRPLIGPRDELAGAIAAVGALPAAAKLVADDRTGRLLTHWGFSDGPYHLLRRQSLRLIPGPSFAEHRRFRSELARVADRAAG